METPCLVDTCLRVRRSPWNKPHPPQASTICHVMQNTLKYMNNITMLREQRNEISSS